MKKMIVILCALMLCACNPSNKEEEIPFLLKYYLIEQIWLNIVRTKDRVYQQSKNERTVQQTFDIPILKKEEEQTTEQ